MKEAIQKAIEGGYKILSWDIGSPVYDKNEVLLDPLFWQSIGKALGWNEDHFYLVANGIEMESQQNDKVWKLYWHRFIDHLASGGEAEKFFKELLNQK